MLAKDEFTFTEDWVKEFYSHVESEPIFEELIEFMVSGPCMVLVLTNESGENVCAEFRELIGNKDPEIAKQEMPDSLRARFGENTVKNGIHGSEPGEVAQKETSVVMALMPDLVIPAKPPKPKLMQMSILIPPGEKELAADKILAKLEEQGYRTIRREDIEIPDDVVDKLFEDMRKDDIEKFSRFRKAYCTG